MAALTPAPDTTGKGLFEGTTAWRSRDDLADRKAGGVYNHSVYEWSATEANEWVGFMQYVRQVAKSGALALKCRNETGGSLAAGPVRVTGYNASEDVFLIGLADADGNSPADFLLLASLANNTNGTAYAGGDFSFNTAGRTVGDPCYLSDAGSVTFTAPSGADQIVQEIGRVKVVNASGTIAGCVQVPTKVGSSYLQSAGGGVSDGDKGDITVSSSGSVWTIDNGVVTFAKMQNIATDRLVGRDTASSGSPEEISVGGGIEFTGSGGIQRSALTGDVTASAGSNATTIANDAVTYAKMQNVSATDRLLGRDTAGAGDVEELTVGGGVEFTGSGGIQRSALTGDVTATAGSNATTIANDAVTTAKILDGNVTFAKIQDTSAASVLIGRGSAAGAGDVQEITIGAGLSMAGTILSGSGLADGDKGDITVTGGGGVWTIDNGVVTLAKQDIASGTTNDIALDDSIPNYDLSATANRRISVDRLLAAAAHVVEGRLTLESTVGVSNTDQTAKTNIYFTPYGGGRVRLYDGTRWRTYVLSERSLALGTLASGTIPNDVFLYDNAGTLTLEKLAWASTTARATALTTQDGVVVKSGDATRLYVGTFTPTSTTTTEDSLQNRHVWNMYNRVPRPLRRHETTTSWTYNSSTFQQANGSSSNQVNVTIGLAETMIDLTLIAAAAHSSGGTALVSGLAEDWVSGSPTTGYSETAYVYHNIPNANNVVGGHARLTKYPAIGKHSYVWIERNTSGATGTFYGNSADVLRCGITGSIVC